MTNAIVWFRRDLRIADNPALLAAIRDCDHLIPLFIHAPDEEAPWSPGGASRWWLHRSLEALDRQLRALGTQLIIRSGGSREILERLVAEHGVTRLYWNRLYDPATIERDKAIKRWASDADLETGSFNAALLNEPWELKTGKGGPYRVFTPYWKACQQRPVAEPSPSPKQLPPLPDGLSGEAVDDLGLRPDIPWDTGLLETWQPGERGAERQLARFVEVAVDHYKKERDLPDREGTSRLSPHLHFGEIGPRQALRTIRNCGDSADHEAYVRELYWREFSHHLLYHFPDTPVQALDPRFRAFPWTQDPEKNLHRWQRGGTGIPIVDAGMRELWHTGWMHNRVRMIVASLLTKNLLIPWQQGAAWFWDTLVDADLANNTLGWQWTAGCGADAAPYFRIFNPVLQGERFDSKGKYVRRWVPELAGLPDKWLHKPWEAPAEILAAAGIRLGEDYPEPIVDLKSSRKQALSVWDEVKAQGSASRNTP